MLKAVLYKIWSRPLILTVFLLICLAQPVSVLLHHQENMRQLCEYYNAWGGPMDDDWKQSIAAQYERLWPQPPKTDITNTTPIPTGACWPTITRPETEKKYADKLARTFLL